MDWAALIIYIAELPQPLICGFATGNAKVDIGIFDGHFSFNDKEVILTSFSCN